MAYEKITAYRLDDGTITDSLEKAESHEKWTIFKAEIKEIYDDSEFIFIAIYLCIFIFFIWNNKDKIKEALK